MTLTDQTKDTLRAKGATEKDIERMNRAVCPVCGKQCTHVNNHKPDTCGAGICRMKEKV